MAVIRYAFVLLGLVLCGLGAAQVQEGIPGFYMSRGIADLQSDANEILLGIVWLIGGLASGVFALAFPGLPPSARLADEEGQPVSSDPVGG